MKKRLLALLISIVMISCMIFAAMIAVSATETEVLPGDFDGNGIVDTRDLIRLREYIANYDYDNDTAPFILPEGSDVNGDDEITLQDIFFLRKFFFSIIT